MKKKIRLGIIGCGKAAEHIYFPILRRDPDFIVTAAADPSDQRRKLAAGNFRGCYVAEYADNKFLSLTDAAIIASPPGYHVKEAAKLLSCSKHVLVEKPLSFNMEGIEDLKLIEKRSEAKLMMAFNHRYWEPLNTLRGVLKERQSSVVSADINYSGNYSMWNPVSFRSDPLNDLGPHVFDIIRYLFGQEVRSVSAVLRDDIYHITISLANIEINTTISHSAKTEKIVTVKTKHDSYFITLGSVRISPGPGSIRELIDIKDRIMRKALMRTSPIKETFRKQLKNFHTMCSTGNQTGPDLSDGIAALKGVSAACLSLERKTEVYLNEIQ